MLKGTSKNSNFFVRAKKHRPESRSLRGVNEDSRTELTPLSRKKCIFRDALKCSYIISKRSWRNRECSYAVILLKGENGVNFISDSSP